MILWLGMVVAFAADVLLSNPYNGSFVVDAQGRGKKAVIFVHDDGKDKRNFAYLSGKLATRKLRTVNFDLLGHGERSDEEAIYPLMHTDVRSVIQYLQDQGVTEIQCVGEGIGGTICMQAISDQTPLHQIAIISPVTTLHHQNLFAHIDSYPDRPIMVITADQEAHGMRTTIRLEKELSVSTHLVSDYRRGLVLLLEYPKMEQTLVNWIRRAPDFRGTWDSVRTVEIDHELNVEGERLPF